jgi:hypothetical protein
MSGREGRHGGGGKCRGWGGRCDLGGEEARMVSIVFDSLGEHVIGGVITQVSSPV